MVGLGDFEIVRYKAIVNEIFQAWIPKKRISTTLGPEPSSRVRDCVATTEDRVVIANECEGSKTDFSFDRNKDFSLRSK